MAASERLIVPINPEDKRIVEARASALGLTSTAEYVRRAALNYEPAEPGAEDELRTLLMTFEQGHDALLAQLDRTDRTLDAILTQMTGAGSSSVFSR